MNRSQKVFVIQRKEDGMFYHGSQGSLAPTWTDDITLANFVAMSKVKGLVCAVWGRDLEDYRTIEVVPTILEENTYD